MSEERKMPPRLDFGNLSMTTMSFPMMQARDSDVVGRSVMGFRLPDWQRGLVWTEAQDISFIESAWLGVNIGTFTYNRWKMGSPLDMLLIDGQQRLNAVERYLADAFPVFGYRYSEIGKPDQRCWSMMTSFGSFVTETDDEAYLRNYYDLMNFSGTPHRPEERAAIQEPKP